MKRFAWIFLVSFGHLLVHQQVNGAENEREIISSINQDTTNSDHLKAQNLTKVQTLLIRQFRAQNIKHLTDDYLLSDNHIIGLLRASQWRISAASKLLTKILRWRIVNHMDALGESEPDADMLARFPYTLNAVDTSGCPVLEVGAGRWQFADFVESSEYVRDALKMFGVHEGQMIEKLRLSVKKLSPKCDQGIVLVNFRDFQVRNIAEPNAISMAIKCGTDAEIFNGNLFKAIIFINTPPEFLSVIKILKTYMGQTGKVMSVYAPEEMDAARAKIYSYIDPAQLSPEV